MAYCNHYKEHRATKKVYLRFKIVVDIKCHLLRTSPRSNTLSNSNAEREKNKQGMNH